MDKSDVARALGQIAALLELKGENPFRVRAYRTAARTVAAFPGDLRAGVRSGALPEAKGIGPATFEIIEELLATGHSRVLEDLQDQIPPGLAELLQISGLGVAKVRQIHETLHVETLTELEEAARNGSLARLPRFGARTAEKILKGIAFLRQAGGQRLWHHAHAEAETLARALDALPMVRHVAVAGSVRRHCELVRDLDLVVVVDGGADPLYGALERMSGVSDLARRDAGAITLRIEGGTTADLYPAAREDFGFHLVRATGSAEHVARLADRAHGAGLRWHDQGITREDSALPLGTEEAVYAALGLPWIPPELREDSGELEAAAAGCLPTLVSREELQGFLHCHSGYSDGTNSVAEWAEAGASRGYAYLGITDHSPATAFGGGLQPGDVPRQHAEIDAVNRARQDIRILKGVEADILADGSLDYTPALRRSFEFIIASVHSRHGMNVEQMTARILKAFDDPTMTILGHPTGRLLLSRAPYPLDLARLFARAAERGVAIEINADPQRLDLDWRVLRQAAEAGVTISIGADAHGVAQMGHAEIGIGIARKGWLKADRILNVQPAEQFLAFARRRRR